MLRVAVVAPLNFMMEPIIVMLRAVAEAIVALVTVALEAPSLVATVVGMVVMVMDPVVTTAPEAAAAEPVDITVPAVMADIFAIAATLLPPMGVLALQAREQAAAVLAQHTGLMVVFQPLKVPVEVAV
jgi:hypothetical protein